MGGCVVEEGWLLKVVGGKPIRLREMVGDWWLARGHGVYAAWLVGGGDWWQAKRLLEMVG